MDLEKAVLAGERLALARLLTLVENGTPEGVQALDRLFQHTGQAHIIGVTGAPGSGKSSLVNQLARAFRLPKNELEPLRVAVIAVDPTSPFSGGALLGDRVRMRDLSGDPGIFIRSMASRGALGGLSHATASMAQVLDAAGFQVVLIETVGVGQSEVDIARLAHSTLVIEAPGMGDEIQAGKAGILEIADILVVNKADHDGAENTVRALRSMLDMGYSPANLHHRFVENEGQNMLPQEVGWIPPVMKTVATEGQGVEELAGEIRRHAAFLKSSGLWNERDGQRLESELQDLLQATLVARWRQGVTAAAYQGALEDLCGRKISPHQAVMRLTPE